eukprot:340067-Rhodomonas_salina.1
MERMQGRKSSARGARGSCEGAFDGRLFIIESRVVRTTILSIYTRVLASTGRVPKLEKPIMHIQVLCRITNSSHDCSSNPDATNDVSCPVPCGININPLVSPSDAA